MSHYVKLQLLFAGEQVIAANWPDGGLCPGQEPLARFLADLDGPLTLWTHPSGLSVEISLRDGQVMEVPA